MVSTREQHKDNFSDHKKPTGNQFGGVLEDYAHKVEDRALFGLRAFSIFRKYDKEECCVIAGMTHMSLQDQAPGAFDPTKWVIVNADPRKYGFPQWNQLEEHNQDDQVMNLLRLWVAIQDVPAGIEPGVSPESDTYWIEVSGMLGVFGEPYNKGIGLVGMVARFGDELIQLWPEGMTEGQLVLFKDDVTPDPNKWKPFNATEFLIENALGAEQSIGKFKRIKIVGLAEVTADGQVAVVNIPKYLLEVTYADLELLVITEALVPGQSYIITDATASHSDEIIVTARNKSALLKKAFSETEGLWGTYDLDGDVFTAIATGGGGGGSFSITASRMVRGGTGGTIVEMTAAETRAWLEVYSKTEIDDMLADLLTDVLADVYTKAEVDDTVGSLQLADSTITNLAKASQFGIEYISETERIFPVEAPVFFTGAPTPVPSGVTFSYSTSVDGSTYTTRASLSALNTYLASATGVVLVKVTASTVYTGWAYWKGGAI